MWFVGTMLLACTNSGLGRDSDDVRRPLEPSPPPAVTEGCPYEGMWDLLDVQCGAFPFDDWFATYTSAELDVVATGGACDVRRELIADGCREVEQMTWAFNQENQADVRSDGVTACTPGGCAFPVAGTCVRGARSDTDDTLGVEFDEETGQLRVTDTPPDGTFVAGAVGCTLDVVTIWERR